MTVPKALTELEQVVGENLLVRRLVGRVVYPNGCPDGEVVFPHEEGRGSRQETKKKTFLRVARGT